VALARLHSDRRREEILGDRLEPRKDAPPFSLATIQGDTVSLARTRGKVVVINFWGVWCSWCIRELPEYQLLYEKYDEDENVLILSINNDKDSQDVTDWLRDRGFTFTTLLDDGYVRSSKVRSFPTTWFLDREGRIVYLQKGYTPNLLEEFSWRIDSLKIAPRP
jgi:thiol-disulfide isomerase/thioredoxin